MRLGLPRRLSDFGRKTAGAVLAVLLAAGAVCPALANGGDFFTELSANWAANDPDSGQSYFGFVRDTKGKFISAATISATAPNGSSFVVLADALGHYTIPGFSKSVNAKLVQVSCSKVGYRLVSRDRRIMMSAPNAPIETDCILTPDPSKPAA